jgi:hypothetical protein
MSVPELYGQLILEEKRRFTDIIISLFIFPEKLEIVCKVTGVYYSNNITQNKGRDRKLNALQTYFRYRISLRIFFESNVLPQGKKQKKKER